MGFQGFNFSFQKVEMGWRGITFLLSVEEAAKFIRRI